ncbi:MAG: hypothetical protein ACLPYB_00315 [Desulfobaccales bacterium]
MKRATGLLLLLALLMSWGCSETNSQSEVGRAATCAMCGASVTGDYFYYTTDRSTGPTEK